MSVSKALGKRSDKAVLPEQIPQSRKDVILRLRFHSLVVSALNLLGSIPARLTVLKVMMSSFGKPSDRTRILQNVVLTDPKREGSLPVEGAEHIAELTEPAEHVNCNLANSDYCEYLSDSFQWIRVPVHVKPWCVFRPSPFSPFKRTTSKYAAVLIKRCNGDDDRNCDGDAADDDLLAIAFKQDQDRGFGELVTHILSHPGSMDFSTVYCPVT